MDKETVRAKMMQQVDQARESAMAGACGWQFEITELVIHTTMSPRGGGEHRYCLKTSFDDFPRRAPSYVFVERTSREISDQAWPPGVKHGANPPGICTPGTREFHEHWHKTDAAYPWDSGRWTFLDTLLRIQRMMEHGLA